MCRVTPCSHAAPKIKVGFIDVLDNCSRTNTSTTYKFRALGISELWCSWVVHEVCQKVLVKSFQSKNLTGI